MTAAEPTLDSQSEVLLATGELVLPLLTLLLLRNRRSWCASFGFGEDRELSPVCVRISAGFESHGMGRCDRSCLQLGRADMQDEDYEYCQILRSRAEISSAHPCIPCVSGSALTPKYFCERPVRPWSQNSASVRSVSIRDGAA